MSYYKDEAMKLLEQIHAKETAIAGPTKGNNHAYFNLTQDKVVYSVQLGGSGTGYTKSPMMSILDSFKEHHEALCHAHEEFKELVMGRTLKVLVFFSSGHVQFDIVTMDNDKITWHTKVSD